MTHVLKGRFCAYINKMHFVSIQFQSFNSVSKIPKEPQAKEAKRSTEERTVSPLAVHISLLYFGAR